MNCVATTFQSSHFPNFPDVKFPNLATFQTFQILEMDEQRIAGGGTSNFQILESGVLESSESQIFVSKDPPVSLSTHQDTLYE